MKHIIIVMNFTILITGDKKMDKETLIFIGLGIGAVLILKNSLMPSIITPAVENIDAGMDNAADYIVKKQMAWNEFAHNSDTLSEKYDNLLIWLGVR